jgi:hypothetical protein
MEGQIVATISSLAVWADSLPVDGENLGKETETKAQQSVLCGNTRQAGDIRQFSLTCRLFLRYSGAGLAVGTFPKMLGWKPQMKLAKSADFFRIWSK